MDEELCLVKANIGFIKMILCSIYENDPKQAGQSYLFSDSHCKISDAGLNWLRWISDDLNVISKIGFCVSRFTGVPQQAHYLCRLRASRSGHTHAFRLEHLVPDEEVCWI
jgi:hypothetical protein